MPALAKHQMPNVMTRPYLRSWKSLGALVLLNLTLILVFIFPSTSAFADDVIREDNGTLAQKLSLPIYVWYKKSSAPKAVLLLVHGATLHGAMFDTLAKELAEDNYLVVAPDMRGFGRWCGDIQKYAPDGRVSFHKTRADLITILLELKQEYPQLPTYCIGESLGGNLALWLAGVCPDLIDGAAASGLCVKRQFILCSTLIVDLLKATVSPNRQIPLAPYARRYLSDNPLTTDNYLKNALVRKRMSLYETFQILHTNQSTTWFIGDIPEKMPILILGGVVDKMFNSRSTSLLFTNIPSRDRTLDLMPKKGHLQLETPDLNPAFKNELFSWLDSHVLQVSQSKMAEGKPILKADSKEIPKEIPADSRIAEEEPMQR